MKRLLIALIVLVGFAMVSSSADAGWRRRAYRRSYYGGPYYNSYYRGGYYGAPYYNTYYGGGGGYANPYYSNGYYGSGYYGSGYYGNGYYGQGYYNPGVGVNVGGVGVY